MKTTRFSGFVFVVLAMLAPPAGAQTPDGVTPSREGICDDLADATPGLYGLCVAVCEAQDCKGIVDPATGDVTLDPSCSPSTDKLLANFRKVAGDPFATPSCIQPPCRCWTESEIKDVGGVRDSCSTPSPQDKNSSVFLNGSAVEGNGQELAYALATADGLRCIRMEMNPFTWDDQTISAEEFQTCRDSVLAEIERRGLTCRQ